MRAPQRHRIVCEMEDDRLPHVLPGPGFRWMVLRRDGRRPLAVMARALLQANNRCAGLPYWSEIGIHETAAGRFASNLSHAAPGATGPTWSDTWLCDSAEAVRAQFLAHDPLVAVSSAGLSGDIRAIQRFRGAWSGLLAAMFGMPHQQPRQPAT
jgi:hypothetical protein